MAPAVAVLVAMVALVAAKHFLETWAVGLGTLIFILIVFAASQSPQSGKSDDEIPGEDFSDLAMILHGIATLPNQRRQ